jgi:uncharacterized membrane protein YebE (DUF533 family)
MNIKGLLGTLIAAKVGQAIGSRGRAGGGGFGNLPSSLGGSAGTALAGALAGMIFGGRKGRSAGGSGLGKLGGLAIIGSIAWQAYQDYQAQQAQQGGRAQPAPAGRRSTSFLDTSGNPFGAAAEPPQGSPLAPASEAGEEELSRILVRAMIAAAKSDGHIDVAEEEAIAGELRQTELSEDDRAFVIAELRGPLDIDAVARGATSPDLASAVYAASLLAITVDTEAERSYLAALAERLRLDPALVASLHAKVEEAAPAA